MKIHIVKKMVIIEHHDLVDEIRIRFGSKIREWFSDDIGRNQLIDCCLLNQKNVEEFGKEYDQDELHDFCDPNEAMIQVCEEISCDPKFKKDYFDLETNMSCTEYRLCIDEGWRLSELENYGLDDSLFKLTNCDCGDGNGVLPHHCDCKDEDKETPTNFDAVQSLDLIWEKLHSYRGFDNDECSVKDEEWDEICTSMSWIEDECGLERKEGVLVPKDEDKVLATRHNDNEVIDVTLTENEAFDEGYRQGKDENKVDMETDILSNIIHKNMIFSIQEDQPTWGHTDKEKIANMDATINEIVDYICKSSIKKPKVRKAPPIPLFLCCWDGVISSTKVLSKTQIYENYPSLAPNGEHHDMSDWTEEFKTFDEMLDSLIPTHFYCDIKSSSYYQYDNMEIRRVR